LSHLPRPSPLLPSAFAEIALAKPRRSGYPSAPLHQIPLMDSDKVDE
jgi:hypothetical protein